MPLRPEDSFYADLPTNKRLKAFGWDNSRSSMPQGTVRREKFRTFEHLIAACKVVRYHDKTFTTAEEIYRHERNLPVQQQVVGNLLQTLYIMTQSFLKNPANMVADEYKKQPSSAQIKNMFELIGNPSPENIKYIEEKVGGKWNPDGTRATHADRPHVGIEGERTIYLVRHMLKYLAAYSQAFGLDLSLSRPVNDYIEAVIANGGNGIKGVPNVAICGEFPLPTVETAKALEEEKPVLPVGYEEEFEVVDGADAVLFSAVGKQTTRSVTEEEAAKLTVQVQAEVTKHNREAVILIKPISALVASATVPEEAPVELAENSISKEEADALLSAVTKQLAAMNVRADVIIKPKAKVANTLGSGMSLSLYGN